MTDNAYALGAPGSAVMVPSPGERRAVEDLQGNAREGELCFLSLWSKTSA